MIQLYNIKKSGKDIGENDIAELKKIQFQVFKKYNLSNAKVLGYTRIFNLTRGNKPLSKDEQRKVAKELKSLLLKNKFSAKVVLMNDIDEYSDNLSFTDYSERKERESEKKEERRASENDTDKEDGEKR